MIFLLLLTAFPSMGRTHPHVFIDNSLRLDFDSEGFAGIQVTWVFDQMFSAAMQMDFDDGDGRLSEKEIAELKTGAFDYLQNYGYFCHIQINGQPFQVKFVKEFTAELKGTSLIYRFHIPCHVSALETVKTIKIYIEDDTNFAAVMTGRKAVSVNPLGSQFAIDLSYEQAPRSLELTAPEAVGPVTIQFRKS